MLLIGRRMVGSLAEPLGTDPPWHELLTEGRHGVVTRCGLTPNPTWSVAVLYDATPDGQVNCETCAAHLGNRRPIEPPNWNPPTKMEERL